MKRYALIFVSEAFGSKPSHPMLFNNDMTLLTRAEAIRAKAMIKELEILQAKYV